LRKLLQDNSALFAELEKDVREVLGMGDAGTGK